MVCNISGRIRIQRMQHQEIFSIVISKKQQREYTEDIYTENYCSNPLWDIQLFVADSSSVHNGLFIFQLFVPVVIESIKNDIYTESIYFQCSINALQYRAIQWVAACTFEVAFQPVNKHKEEEEYEECTIVASMMSNCCTVVQSPTEVTELRLPYLPNLPYLNCN